MIRSSIAQVSSQQHGRKYLRRSHAAPPVYSSHSLPIFPFTAHIEAPRKMKDLGAAVFRNTALSVSADFSVDFLSIFLDKNAF